MNAGDPILQAYTFLRVRSYCLEEETTIQSNFNFCSMKISEYLSLNSVGTYYILIESSIGKKSVDHTGHPAN
ncbi:hypothetical protein L2E82_33545 [Cichorium intybus]|uniref:Uncharacterized protein n=1 Tax=Cichorium intybus TaxID=13427 RepID=A0ACB9BKF3_CICIN|nr:hypothetical protein L2E82_33545 [Cichorium intybus]